MEQVRLCDVWPMENWLGHEPHTGLEDCLRILQAYFRARMSGERALTFDSSNGAHASKKPWCAYLVRQREDQLDDDGGPVISNFTACPLAPQSHLEMEAFNEEEKEEEGGQAGCM